MVALVGRMLDLNKRAHDMKPGHARTVIEREIAATDRTVDELVYELCGSPTRRSGSSRRRRRGRAGSVRAGLRQRRRGGAAGPKDAAAGTSLTRRGHGVCSSIEISTGRTGAS
jgi:hypothetical protein